MFRICTCTVLDYVIKVSKNRHTISGIPGKIGDNFFHVFLFKKNVVQISEKSYLLDMYKKI